MGVWGAIIMGFFGAVFAALTLALPLHWTGAAIGLPFLGFVGIAVAAIIVMRRPGTGLALTRRGELAIVWSSTAEGVGIFVAVNIVNNLGHPEWLLPAMALLTIAVAGFAIGTALGATIAGFAAAAALWLAALRAIIRDSRARALSA